jgi:hypothetical protein
LDRDGMFENREKPKRAKGKRIGRKVEVNGCATLLRK